MASGVKKLDVDVDSLMGLLSLDIRRRVVASLLAGNDAGCFSTEQYKAEYERQQPMPKGYERPGIYWKLDPETDLARVHLLSTGMVREVRPGVWAAK